MDVSGWLAARGTTLSLFPARRHGPARRLLGRVLGLANAGAAAGHFGDRVGEFYALKRVVLAKYGEPCGTDWQYIHRRCWGCEACDPEGYWSNREAQCDGEGNYARKWIPLARHRLGGRVFHTPGTAVYADPGVPVRFTGLVRHAAVGWDDARAAFLTLALWLDRPLFCRAAADFFPVEEREQW